MRRSRAICLQSDMGEGVGVPVAQAIGFFEPIANFPVLGRAAHPLVELGDGGLERRAALAGLFLDVGQLRFERLGWIGHVCLPEAEHSAT